MSTALMWLLDGIANIPATEARVADLTLDSRAVRSGSLFFALAGRTTHGLAFAAEAAQRGASVILWEPPAAPPGGAAELAALPAGLLATSGVFAAPVPGLKQLIGRIADRFFNWPSAHMRITGITGTNGKTTCGYLLAQCFEQLGLAAAYIGTIGWGRPSALAPPTHTTPDAVTLHRELAQLRSSGVREVAMEVSSHALDQGRVNGVRFTAAALTNLTRDHLDYHGSMTHYGDAKAKLFKFDGLQQVVLNIGDGFGRELARRYAGGAQLTAVWVGNDDMAWVAERVVHVTHVDLDSRGLILELDGSFGAQRVHTQLLGRFNAENSVIVIACLASLGVPLRDAAEALARCSPAPGRMETIAGDAPGKPTVVVDYAHTPDALAKALRAAREHCEGLLWCVFGCGGDRDPGKREVMGAIADELADRIIVTDDNPRSEDPQAITAAIVKGIRSRAARVIHDRGRAIRTALTEADPLDWVLIAGKGHEDYQIYGATRRDFSDRREALRYLGAAA